ncbi:MAG: hypothetical protein WD768_16255 [Phycisphaeraceae bacterium]
MRMETRPLLFGMVLPMVFAAFVGAAEGPAKEAEAEAANPLTTPANPLTDVDPFAGEFEGDELIVVVKVSGDGYVGEIRRAGRSFPMKAVREGKQMVGSFSFEKSSFRFTARFDGQSLSLHSGDKDFTLKRRVPDGAAPATPDPTPTPPEPALPHPAPTVPRPDPAPVRPAPATETPAERLSAIDYSKLNSEALRDLAWTRFPAGTYAVFEEVFSTPNTIGVSARQKLVYSGFIDDKPAFRGHLFENGLWQAEGQLLPPRTDKGYRIQEMGYTPGDTRSESLTVGEKTLQCDCTRYSTEANIFGEPMTIQIEVWRSRESDHPAMVMDLPDKRLLVEPNVARVIASGEHKTAKVVLDLKLDARKEMKIGRITVMCDVLKGTSTLERLGEKTDLYTEHWLSHQIPGGIAKTIEDQVVGKRAKRRSSSVVEFGVSK